MIFVVDCNDNRIDECREELWRCLNYRELANDVPLLVMANKQDLPNAMNAAEITDKLGLQEIRDRKWCKWLFSNMSTGVSSISYQY